ncbi:MAG: 30S ribosomal protein S3Ae [Methanonatronarchaeales archaeon]|nr:30S ribosomal protein S3Ae [Methanonatronarchaeales archaeon]
MARRTTRRSDWSTKNWFTVVAPEEFGEKAVGETVAEDEEKLVGRTVETTYGELSGDTSKQNTKIRFQVKSVAGENAHTKFVGHELTSDYVGSLVKRRTSRVDGVFDVLTRDGFKVRVKPLLFTTRQCDADHKGDLRTVMEEQVKEFAVSNSFDQFVTGLVDGTLASDLYREGRKVYPLRRAEIRKSELIAEPSEVEEVPEGFDDVAERAGVEA